MSDGSNSELPFADSLGSRMIWYESTDVAQGIVVNIEGKSVPLYSSILSVLHSRSQSNLSWETNTGKTIQAADPYIPGQTSSLQFGGPFLSGLRRTVD